MLRFLPPVLLAAVLGSTALAALATPSMRCGQHLILPGDTKLKVLQECGLPEYREVVSGEDEPREEQWIYSMGEGQFPYLLTFRGVTLVQIEVLTRP